MKTLVLTLVLLLALAVPAYADSIELAWTPPTTNVDGTPLTDLAGFNIFMDGLLLETIPNPAASVYVVTAPIPEGAHTFTLTAYDTSGNESTPSNEVSVIVKIPPGNPTNLIIRILK